MEYKYLNCGGMTIRYCFIYPETERYFGRYLSKEAETEKICDIEITKEYMEQNRWLVDENEESESYLEFQSLMLATGNHILEYNRALFHGTCFKWKEKAWIFTAPSGTGKTTQLMNWKRLFGKEVKVINGDKPMLASNEDGSIIAYSSPWRGKERYGVSGLSAPLGGIIILEQGKTDIIRKLKAEEAVLALFTEFVSYPETVEQIKAQGALLERILDQVPVWKLINRGNEESAYLTRKAIEEEMEVEG